jgi:hypothetical protein
LPSNIVLDELDRGLFGSVPVFIAYRNIMHTLLGRISLKLPLRPGNERLVRKPISTDGEFLSRLFFFSFQHSANILRADGQFNHLSLDHVLFEMAAGNRLHLLKKKILLYQGKNQEGDKEIPDAEMGFRR